MSKDKNELSPEDNELRERTALEIYLRKLSGDRRGIAPKVVAAEAFRDAKAFCEIASEFRENGEEALEKVLPIDDGLDYFSAPNLPDEHPFNLGSKRFGNATTLAKLNRLKSNEETYRAACNNVNARI